MFSQWVGFLPQEIYQDNEALFATLRQLGHLSSGYIDDSWLMGTVWDYCAKNVVDTV